MLETLKSSSKLAFLQQNVNKNSLIIHSCLQIGLEHQVDFVLFQELQDEDAYERGIQLPTHPSYYCILPADKSVCPRVAIYARKLSRFQVQLRSDICSDPDLLIVDIIDTKGQFVTFQLLNIYNEKSQKDGSHSWTVERSLQHITPSQHAIICGDFNAHHPRWNSTHRPERAEVLIDWLDMHDFSLINDSEQTGTFHRHGLKQKSVLDLTFFTSSFEEKSYNWWIEKGDDSGSDHAQIQFTIELDEQNLLENPVYANQYNFKNVDWELLRHEVQQLSNQSQYQWSAITLLAADLDREAVKLQDLVLAALDKHVPKKRFSEHSKPWWTEELTQKRKQMAKAKRIWQKTQVNLMEDENSSYLHYKKIRNDYFSAIKQAKSECWNQFLEGAEGRDIFKAFQYTKSRKVERLPILEHGDKKAITFQEKCDAFMSVLFQKPPSSENISWADYQENSQWTWPEVTKDEVQQAIFTSSTTKAAGPDGIGFLILQKLFPVLENHLVKLYQALIKTGYHPKCWKEAIGVILPKLNRDMTLPKSYRVISLLNCLGKTAEKIVATRLSYFAATSDLLYQDQIGGRKQRSAVDAVLSLVHDVQLAKSKGLVTSALFLDVKGAFDHVSSSRLAHICQKLGLPKCLIQWILSFLQDRSIQLAFDGNIQQKRPIDIGIPQGSPISPILFLIYVSELFKNRSQDDIRTPSYIDDIALIVSSPTVEENCNKLRNAVQELFSLQRNCCIQFDLDKSDLIHFFSNNLEEVELSAELSLQPKSVIRWLGVWLDTKLLFKFHVEKKIADADRILSSMIRLSNTERGLSFQAMRQLYIACITSVADYGVPVWWKKDKQQHLLDKYQTLQNKALRKVLGAFKSSPIRAMEIEASLPPPVIRFQKLCKNYALRLLTIDEEHPLRQRVSSSFPPFSTGLELDWSRYCDWNETPQSRSKKREVSQLFKLYSLIKKYLPSLKIEESDHRQLSPWKPCVANLVDIKLSSLSKEEETIAHTAQLKHICSSQRNSLIIYSDGSKHGETDSLEAGLAVKTSSTSFTQYSWNIGKSCEVFDAELYALDKAFQYVIKASTSLSQIQDVWIFSDSQAAIQRLQSNHIKAGQNRVNSITRLVTKTSLKDVRLHLQWVPSHMGIEGNEEADKAAKSGTLKPCSVSDACVSLSFVKRKIKENCLLNWQRIWETQKVGKHYIQFDTVPKWRPSSLRLPKQLWSTITQLKLGVGYFRYYLNRLPDYSSADCPFCETTETPEHLLLHCSEWTQYRKELKQKLGLQQVNMKFLFQTQSGLKYLIDYLSHTKLATRLWLKDQSN